MIERIEVLDGGQALFYGTEAVAGAFYFSHRRDVADLPIYRIIAQDGTRFYLDPASGAPIAKIDRGAQGYRWLHESLHRMDLALWSRGRPQWDVFMLSLMCGVTALCLTGAYLGCRRLLSGPIV
jgi:hypothetical protein